MATNEIAGITLAVDVSQVDRGTQSLQKFRQANQQAASGISEFVNAEQVARTQARDTARALAEQQASLAKLQTAIDPTAAKFRKLQEAAVGLDKAFAAGVVPDEEFFRLGEALETQNAKLARSRAALTEEGRAAAQAAKEKAAAKAAADRFIASLERQAQAASLTREEYLKLQASQLGVTAQAAPLINQIGTATQRTVENLGRQAAAFQKSGLSAGQYKNAISQLPAQITDIGTSLAGGIPIWLIAIQQGGQIKDSFGGIANTARFLLSYLNPLTVAAGVLGAGFAYAAVSIYQSESAIKAARKAVEETLGVTDEAARQLSVSIAKISEASGKTAEDIAKSFVSTRDGAQEAILKLIDVGVSYDEARELVERYKDASNFTQVNAQIEQHRLEAAKIQDSWFENAKAVSYYNDVAVQGLVNSPLTNVAARNSAAIQEFASILEKDVNQALIDGNRYVAEQVDLIGKEYLALDRVAGAEKSLADARKQAAVIARSGNAEAIAQANRVIQLRQRELDEAKKAEAERNKPAKTKAPKEARDLTINYESGVLALEAQLRLLQDVGGQTKAISTERRKLLEEEAKFAILEERQAAGTIGREQARLILEKDKVLELARQKAELGDQIVLQERANKLAEDNRKKILQINNEANNIGFGAGLSSREKQRAREIQSLQSNQLNKGGSVDDTDFQALLEARRNFYAQEDALRENWLAGVNQSFANWAESATDAFSIAGSLTTKVFEGITDQITDLVTTGETNFREFTVNILKQIARIATQLLIVKAIESSLSSFGGTGGAIGSIASAIGGGFASGGYTGDGGKYQPAGTVHKGEFVFTKEATSRIGVKNLYALMRGYANGGVVGGPSGYANGGLVSGGADVNVSGITVNVNSGIGSDPEQAKALQNGVKAIVAEEIAQSFQQGGRAFAYLRGFN
ncbi:tail type measure protein [Escherichia phage TR1]|nr:tail type measure protein [Escherichia phage TR1]